MTLGSVGIATSGSPLVFHLHLVVTSISLALGWTYLVAIAQLGPKRNLMAKSAVDNGRDGVGFFRRISNNSSAGERFRFFSGLLTALALDVYPLADLARNISVLVHLMTQIILALVAVPLVLSGIPRWLSSYMTRPRYLDHSLRILTRPLVASAIFTGTMVASMAPPIVELQAASALVTSVVKVAVVLSATFMWAPVLKLLPGSKQLSTTGKIAYLFALSLIPNFPSVVLLFAQHSFYPIFAHNVPTLGFSAIADQQLAGALSKLIAIAILWGVAAKILLKASTDEEQGLDPEPLTWDDVERELARTSRKAAQSN